MGLSALNNLKFARFKGIFPGSVKSDSIDAHKGLDLFELGDAVFNSNIAESKNDFRGELLGYSSRLCGKFLPRKILRTNSQLSWGERSSASLISRPRE